ncbi:Calx-beta domain-containing protein [Pontiella sp.]|uniref:Calx-beta domain-containing protein n=1 Tax=Pontiella sp. TaxID=2837462 RepID=UPI00356290B0
MLSIRKSLALILFSLVSLAVRSDANTHTVDEPNGNSNWTLTVQVNGADFLEEKADYLSDVYSLEKHVMLYRIKKSASVEYTFHYAGGTGDSPTYSINGMEGTSFSQEIEIPRDTDVALGGGVIIANVSWEQDNGSGGREIVTIEARFVCQIHFYKPLGVELRNSYGAGVSYSVVTSYVTPYIQTDAGGYSSIQKSNQLQGDVGVKIEPAEGSPIRLDSGWSRSDSGGVHSFHAYADLDSDQAVPGWVFGDVVISAVKGGVELEVAERIDIPFAIVTSVYRAAVRDEISGGLGETVFVGMQIQEGTGIQVGTDLLSGYLNLRFCDGTDAFIEAAAAEGLTVYVGKGTLVQGANLLTISLRNTLQEWKDTPRRCMRLRVHKTLGGILDTALGVPDSVGIVSETPGSVVEKWLINWTEEGSYKPFEFSAPPTGAMRASSAFAETLARTTESSDPVVSRAAIRTDFGIYTDGKIYAENMAGNLRMELLDGGPAGILPAGEAAMILPERAGQSGTLLSEAATGSTAWSAPAPAAWTFTPADAETITTRTPAFTVSTADSQGIVPESFRILLDGTEVTRWFTIDEANLSGEVPATRPLTNGLHTLAAGCLTLQGDWEEQSVSFTVLAEPEAVETPDVAAFSDGVWLSWAPTADAAGYRVWRAPSETGTQTLLTPAPRTQPGFLDEAPLPDNHYWIEAVDAFGQTAPQTAVSCVWSNGLPAARAAAAPGTAALLESPAGVQVDFDASGRAYSRWTLRSAPSASGPFTDLLPGEQTVASGFVDTNATPGATLFYELATLRLDGTAQSVQTQSVVCATIPSAPVAPYCMPAATGLRISWNPYADFRADGLRLYRLQTTGYELLATLDGNATDYIDTEIAAGENALYQLRAYGSGGESAFVAAGGARPAFAPEAAVVNLPAEALWVHEGDGTVTVPVTRTGNLAQPALIAYRVWNGGKAQAVEDVDFEKTANTLFFAAGQTATNLTVALLPDSEYEWTEGFSVTLGTGFGATEAGANATLDINVEDSDIIIMADYASEMSVDETNAQAQVWVERVVPSTRAVSCELSVAADPGTAVAGVDYTAFAPIAVVFPSGVTRVACPVPLLDDADKDGTKQLRVTLSNPAGGACVSEWNSTLAINIRDDETKPGQIRPQLADTLLVVPPGQDSVQIPLVREGGTDGSISVWPSVFDGNLPWGAISTVTTPFGEGTDSGTLTVTLDRSGLDGRMAPCGVLSIANNDYPGDLHSVLLVFHPDGAPASDYAAWIAGYSLGSETNAMDDADDDGARNVAEFALGSEPDDPDSRPGSVLSMEYGGFAINRPIRPDPYLAVVAEFSDALDGDVSMAGGWWTWNETALQYDAEFNTWLN